MAIQITPESYEEYLKKVKENLNLIERLTGSASGLDERIDITNQLLIQMTGLLSESLILQMPKLEPEPPAVILPPYNVIKLLLDTARASPGGEIQLPGDTITAYTDGSLSDIYLRINLPTNDAIPISEFNPYHYPATFDRFWIETPAQSGKYLRLHVGRKGGAMADTRVSQSKLLLYVVTATGASTIAKTAAPGARFQLLAVRLHMSAAPTTSQDFTVTLDAEDGSAYDTILYKRDLSVGSVTDLYVPFGEEYIFESGDEIDVAYANDDTGTYGLAIMYKLV